MMGGVLSSAGQVSSGFFSAADHQKSHAETIGDHVVVLGERHLRHVLLSYMNYYNETRTHLSLNKDSPLSRTVKRAGRILCRPILGGLHHKYVRS
jgi:hypothetical protein